MIVNEKKIVAALSLNAGRWDLYFEGAGVAVTVDAILIPTTDGDPDWRALTPGVMRRIVDGDDAYGEAGAADKAPSRRHTHGDSNDGGSHG